MTLHSRIALALVFTLPTMATADDDRQRDPADVSIDLSRLTFRTDGGDQVDAVNLSFEKGNLQAQLPFANKRLRAAKKVRFDLPVDQAADSVVATYRVRLGEGMSHDVMIEASNGLILFYFHVVANKTGGDNAELITADEWHEIRICQTREGYSGEVDGKELVASSRSSPGPLRALGFEFTASNDEVRTLALKQFHLSTRRK